jgi:16S rRNA (guanine527-N7)-methyltransferase
MSTSASTAFPDLLCERLSGVLELLPVQVAALESHYQLLLKWNRVVNLTSVSKPAEIVERHYCESLFVGGHLPAGEFSIVDIGSGPGFPGLPIAILRPDCRITLVESHQRKAVFLKEATRSLPNVRVLAVRGETLTETYDWVVSRAVSYEDLAPILAKLARSVALLTGGEGPPAGTGFDWVRSVKLPWGTQRFLRIGTRFER